MGEDKELIRRGGDDTVDAAGGHGRGEPRGEAGGQTRLPQKNRGAPWKGEGRSNRCGWSAAGRGPPSSSILAGTPREGGGGVGTYPRAESRRTASKPLERPLRCPSPQTFPPSPRYPGTSCASSDRSWCVSSYRRGSAGTWRAA